MYVFRQSVYTLICLEENNYVLILINMNLSSTISKVFAVIFLKTADGSRLYSRYYPKHFPP